MPPKKKRGGKKKQRQGTVAEDRDNTGAQEKDNGKPKEVDPAEEDEGRGYQDSNYGEDDDRSDPEKKSKTSKTRLSVEEKEDKILLCERYQHKGNTCNKVSSLPRLNGQLAYKTSRSYRFARIARPV